MSNMFGLELLADMFWSNWVGLFIMNISMLLLFGINMCDSYLLIRFLHINLFIYFLMMFNLCSNYL